MAREKQGSASRLPNVAVIVLNWQRSDLLRRCVASVQFQRAPANIHLIVFDNESSAESRAEIGDRLSGADLASGRRLASKSLLACEANLGFAAGMNRAIEYARDQFGPGFFWLLNNDVELDDGALAALVEAAGAHPQWGILGSRIQGEPLARGKPLYGGYRYQPWFSRIRPCLHPDMEPDYIAGAAMFIRAELLDQVGLLSEAFFLYGEELDLARRATRAGWHQGCAGESVVWHHSGRSVSARSPIPGRSARWAREFFENRSAFLLAWEHDRWKFPIAASARVIAKSIWAIAGRCELGAVIAALKAFRRPLPKFNDKSEQVEAVQLTLAESGRND